MVNLPTPAQHGWNEEGDIFWTDDIFPDNLNDYVAMNEDNDEEEDFEDDIEGDVFDEDDDDEDDYGYYEGEGEDSEE